MYLCEERERERVWPDNRRKKIVGEHRKSRRRGSDRECYKLYCISPGKVIGLHLWCWAWTEHLSTATSAGNSHHDNPTQHNRIDLQAEDNSINTASSKHKTCHCRTTWPPAHMRRREMFPFCSGCRKSNHSKQHSVNAVYVISVCTASVRWREQNIQIKETLTVMILQQIQNDLILSLRHPGICLYICISISKIYRMNKQTK